MGILSQRINMSGQRFGRLLVLDESKKEGAGKGQVRWLCRFDGGTIKFGRGADIRNGKIVSCGCLRDEQTGDRVRTHGQTNTPIYRSWTQMKTRVSNPNILSAHLYTGKGITVCYEMSTFDGFVRVMGEKPPRMSVERINGDHGYWCGTCYECVSLGREKNVKWATYKEQASNTSRNRYVIFNGERTTQMEAARRLAAATNGNFWGCQSRIIAARRIYGDTGFDVANLLTPASA